MNTVYTGKANISLCEKKLWLDINSDIEESCSNDIESDYADRTVQDFAYRSFDESTRIKNDSYEIMAAETKRLMDDCRSRLIITDAVFAFKRFFIHIDRLLVRADGRLEICEIKAATHVKDGFVKDISYKCAVLSLLGYDVKRVYIRYVNGSYIRNGELDAKKFFCYKDITEEVLYYSNSMNGLIKKAYSMTFEPKRRICMNCLSPHKCRYWSYCTRELPGNNVFDVAGLSMDKKFELYEDGIVSFDDIERNDCVSKRQMEQVSAALHCTEPIINKKEINDFIRGLSYPLYFLDFETFQSAVPLYDGVAPFTQISFQYSLHYIECEGGELRHKEFLAGYGRDPRRELAVRLVRDIPGDACVIAYNMAFEKGVIRKLANMFADLHERLMKIHDNIKDLMLPFQKHYYYDRRMNGSHSLKAVLPALFPDNPEMDYGNLDTVHNGMEAMLLYQQAAEADYNTQCEIRECLLRYCRLDTLAMVKILQKLIDVTI